MKLKEFTPGNCPTSRSYSGTPTIGINVKTGLFRVSSVAKDIIGLKDGDQVILHQDDEDPINWYIEKVKDGGFILRQKESTGQALLFNNSTLAKHIAASVEFTGKSGKVIVAGEPTLFQKRKLFGLLTSYLVNV